MIYQKIFLNLCTIVIVHNLILLNYVNTIEWNILEKNSLKGKLICFNKLKINLKNFILFFNY